MSPRAKIQDEYKKMIAKHCCILEAHPYCLKEASDALRAWVNGTQPLQPPLNISYITSLRSPNATATVTPSIQFASSSLLGGAIALEPDVNEIRVERHRGETKVKPEASDEMECALPIAKALVEDHLFNWPAGLAVGRQVFAKLQEKRRLAERIRRADKADGEEPLEIRLLPR